MCIPTISSRFSDLSVNKNSSSAPVKSVAPPEKPSEQPTTSQPNILETSNKISDLRSLLKDDSSPVSNSIEQLFNKGFSATSTVVT